MRVSYRLAEVVFCPFLEVTLSFVHSKQAKSLMATALAPKAGIPLDNLQGAREMNYPLTLCYWQQQPQ